MKAEDLYIWKHVHTGSGTCCSCLLVVLHSQPSIHQYFQVLIHSALHPRNSAWTRDGDQRLSILNTEGICVYICVHGCACGRGDTWACRWPCTCMCGNQRKSSCGIPLQVLSIFFFWNLELPGRSGLASCQPQNSRCLCLPSTTFYLGSGVRTHTACLHNLHFT